MRPHSSNSRSTCVIRCLRSQGLEIAVSNIAFIWPAALVTKWSIRVKRSPMDQIRTGCDPVNGREG
jgi:hypothetical protein